MFRMNVQQPWLDLIISGKKTVEGRRGGIEKFEPLLNTVIEMFSGETSVRVKIVKIEHFDDLKEYLDGVGVERCAPHLKTKEDVIEAYGNIVDKDGGHPYSEENIKLSGGMNALHLKLV